MTDEMRRARADRLAGKARQALDVRVERAATMIGK
jgi:hypothetical protein